MKVKYHYILLLALNAIALSCKKDNYEPPSSALTGRIVYKGEPIQVEYDQVPFELYQYGFGKVGAINGTITPEGTFSHLVFDGEYKFVVRPGQGPFLWPQTGGKADSISISMSGSKSMDIEVVPYYMIRSPQISKTGTDVTASFKLEKIITDAINGKNIESASLYVNKTLFVSGTDNIAKTNVAGSAITDPNSVTLKVAIPTITPVQNYIFARVGLKIEGVEDLIFSPVVKIII
jgi:hypothetical protein